MDRKPVRMTYSHYESDVVDDKHEELERLRCENSELRSQLEKYRQLVEKKDSEIWQLKAVIEASKVAADK
jgi:hypothetical protein